MMEGGFSDGCFRRLSHLSSVILGLRQDDAYCSDCKQESMANLNGHSSCPLCLGFFCKNSRGLQSSSHPHARVHILGTTVGTPERPPVRLERAFNTCRLDHWAARCLASGQEPG